MSYYIQSYGKGYIQRNGDKYELVVNGEVVESYKSIDTLVQYNPVGAESDAGSEATTDSKSKSKAKK
ncbi:hypothetical protein LR392_04670 [Arthrobacter sp. AK04]|uniref:hypothetical protein n=1 Tax=Arthrobacter sp. AK04 TaxID=2900048 RepID=UPI001E2D1B6C|nr:hypothetical protein [Arthrobacter sp. AK04]MCD5341522.1 hypothetical protein [Arthrobacter sp. AK04]